MIPPSEAKALIPPSEAKALIPPKAKPEALTCNILGHSLVFYLTLEHTLRNIGSSAPTQRNMIPKARTAAVCCVMARP